jgi:DMSO/TMAO reductase YedYZ molybdopterin-dependent catalytic subunit
MSKLERPERAAPQPKPGAALFRPQLAKLERRLFLKQGLSLGAMALLSGCNLKDDDAVDRALHAMSRFSDRVQAALFDPNRLAPTYSEAEITTPFPFNAYYDEENAPAIDGDSYRLELDGRIADKTPWTLARLRELPQTSQITRHVCVEGWSAVGKWGGAPFRLFLERIGADLSAKYVGFECADKYSTSIDMPSALHPQTLLALDFPGRPGETKYGFPVKLRIPTKLGFKNPKFVAKIVVTNDNPGGYWENLGYNWYSGS